MSTERQPQPAAAVILLRAAEPGEFEIFLIRRSAAASVFGGVYCFPTGSVRLEDSSPSMVTRCRGVTQDTARRIVGAHYKGPRALGFWIAAARELFEQTGVLLAGSESDRSVVLQPDCNAGANKTSRIDFLWSLESRGLFCDAGKLLSFSHWLISTRSGTPLAMRFFLAPIPESQSPVARTADVEDTLWLAPDRALQLFHRGQLPLSFPAFASLRTLADFDTLDNVLHEFRSRTVKTDHWVLE